MGLYPEIEPYEHGMLDVGDGNEIYWETCGNPAGKPAVVLHGGPGSGVTPGYRRYFDPAAYRIVLLDQRGCGRSTPHASEPSTDLSVNTTAHLIADLELLREHLGIERWLVWGASWGSVLGLRYAELYPSRVTEMVLTCLATGSQAEVDVMTRGLGRIFPEAWQEFMDGVPDPDPATGYAKLLASDDPAVRERAARAWCDWETAAIPAPPRSIPRYEDPDFRMAFARIVTHYWSQGHFLGDDGVILREADALKGIPGAVIQGGLDFGNLVGTPWRLAAAWPDAELTLVDEVGHDASGSADLLVAATDRFVAGRREAGEA